MRRASKYEDFTKIGKDPFVKVHCDQCDGEISTQFQDLGGVYPDKVYVCYKLGVVHLIASDEMVYDINQRHKKVVGYYTICPAEPVFRMVEVQYDAVRFTQLVQLTEEEAEKYLSE